MRTKEQSEADRVSIGLLVGTEGGEALLRELEEMAADIERRTVALPEIVTAGDARRDFLYRAGTASGVRSVVTVLRESQKTLHDRGG